MLCFYNHSEYSYISDGSSQTIAILDTGLNNQLLDKYNKHIIDTYNVVDHSNNVEDVHGHGSSLTSLLLGFSGVKGLCDNVNVVIVKICDDNGNSTNEYLLEALKYVEDKVDVVNISLGGNIEDEKVTSQIHNMITKDIDIVVASGDYGNKDLLYPANIDGVISVGSINKNYHISDFTNYEDSIICCFPGESIKCYDGIYSGTSYASIIASGYLVQIRDYMKKNNIKGNTLEIMKAINPYQTKTLNLKKSFINNDNLELSMNRVNFDSIFFVEKEV
jgi:subtilisin family serine protease